MNTIIEKGNLLLKEGRFEEARIYVIPYIEESKANGNDKLHYYELLYIYAFSFIRRGLAKDAIPVVHEMLLLCSFFTQQEKLKREFTCNNILGLLHFELSYNEEGLQYLEKAYAIAVETDDKNRICTVTGNLGLIHSALSHDVKALELLKYSEELAIELQNNDHLAIVFDNTASIFNKHGDYIRALDYYSKALELHTEMKSKDGIGRALGHLGTVYLQMKNLDKAKSFLRQALIIHEAIEYNRGIAIWNEIMGEIMLDEDDPDTAQAHFMKAIETNRELGNKEKEGIHIGLLGNVCKHKKQYEEALSHYAKALEHLEEFDSTEHKYAIQHHIASILSDPSYENYNPVLAEDILLNELDGVKKRSLKSIENDYLILLCDIQKQRKDWEKALYYYESSVQLKEDIFSSDIRNTIREMEFQKEYNEMEQKRLLEVMRLQEKEQLLHEILPSHVADRIIGGEKTIAEECEDMTIMFADIVGFTTLSEHMKPSEIIELLNTVYSKLDLLADTYGIEKIKTIGDAYMAISDGRGNSFDHKVKMLTFAKEILAICSEIILKNGKSLEVRIGIHSGPTVTGVIGTRKLSYDVWGDAVNTAARMESYGEPGTIQVSREFYESIRNIEEMVHTTVITEKEIAIKGKGLMNTVLLQ